ESSLELDTDDGSSPISEPSSPVPRALTSSQQVRKTSLIRVSLKSSKKWRSKAIKPRSKRNYSGNVSETNSLLLLAGTSSRGRKILRKEDMNFVT
ncbi:hypothetical protein SK128_007951, partial [Halocaridina rubra]